ncbi:MAG: Holliday junction branch migration protein RuvA [Thermoflavifilum aggregans]|nr:Holliday junction branch migration protein RuvA [Thermoflavifilum aggregans]
MFAYLTGKITYRSPAVIHLDVQGVGYEIQISLNTFSQIAGLEECRLYTYLHVQEDAHTLYGFYHPEEKEIFCLLIGVSGIGAATARMILSRLTPEEIHRAILSEDEQMLSSVKGIGPKTAKRLILELKDKMLQLTSSRTTSTTDAPASPADAFAIPSHNSFARDALNALIALGIAKQTAEAAVSKALKEATPQSLEDLIKRSLKYA